jgi:hypothetical protein
MPLCTDIRKHSIPKENFKELRPKEFYLHLDERDYHQLMTEPHLKAASFLDFNLL